MKNIAIVLSGCGVFDGSEIHETVATMLAINQVGANYQCLAPDIQQTRVINHLTQQPMQEKRNVLVEAARIARGNIKDISSVTIDEFDAAMYPGGFGAACNSSDFAEKGADMSVQPDILQFAKTMADAGKPQGFLCIAPALIAKIYGPGVIVTIGNDTETANTLEKMGAKHQICNVSEVTIDKQHKVVSSPAYMLAANINEVFASANACVTALLKLI